MCIRDSSYTVEFGSIIVKHISVWSCRIQAGSGGLSLTSKTQGGASKRMQLISYENCRSKSKNEMQQNEKFPIDWIVRLRISEGSMISP